MERGRVDYFERGLKNVIDSFEKAREWADLSNCLQKVKKQIDTNKNLPIPRQRDLAKRLAQCLNPEINVIHQLTLEVYKEVFEREIEMMNIDYQQKNIGQYERKSSIALFFSGLFNFYQFAAFEVKQSFLELINNYLLKMKKELILSLPGFMLCMLPALEDQNGEMTKKVENILLETEKIVGTSEFYGEIWKAMLRTPRARLSAIRFLEKRIPKSLKHAKEYRDKGMINLSEYTIKIINREVSLTKDIYKQKDEQAKHERMELHDYFYFYYPNKSKLVINALVSGLSIVEPQTYVNRGTLDFMISHMPINLDINSIEENIRLVECATLAYTKRDFATQNKIQNWLFGHIDEDEDEIDQNDPAIITIVESQKNLFRKSMDLNQTVSYVKHGLMDQGKSNQQAGINKQIIDPIQILLRIFSDEQQTTVPILKNLSIHLIKFVRFHLKNRHIDLIRFKQILVNLLDQISHQYKAVLESLAIKLQQEIENLNFDQGQIQQQNQFESIDLISFAIFDLLQLQRKLLHTPESQQYLTQILSYLLKGMDKISNNHQNLELILPSLDLIEQILNILKKINDGAMLIKQKKKQIFKESIQSFNNLYVMMSKTLIENGHDEKIQIDTFKKYNNIMFEILHLQDVDHTMNQMPDWLEMLIQTSKTSITKICLVSAFTFIKLLGSTEKSGGSVMHIQRLIAYGNVQNQQTNKIINQQEFYHNFLPQLQLQQNSDEGDLGVKNGKTHCKEIIQNLWSILDQEIEIDIIVNLLRQFDIFVPKIFSSVVVENLNSKVKDTRQKGRAEDAIKKFTVFWKFTSNQYPSYKPFETEINGKKYLALHNMINFLEDTDPTLRLSCRSWLSQSNRYFNRILDPLIEEFIQNSNFAIDKNNNVIINGKLETQYVIQNFGKLRNIILNSQDDIIEYMIIKMCQPHIVLLYNQSYQNKSQSGQAQGNPQDQKNINLEKEMSLQQRQQISSGQIESKYNEHIPLIEQDFRDNINYLDILVEITLQFIRAEYSKEYLSQAGQSKSRENQQAETLTVNASACEFMELILKQAEKYNQISFKIAHFIIKPLIDTFHHVIMKKNYAMQVNLINLLQLILLECNFQGTKVDNQQTEAEIKNNCIKLFKDPKLIDSIILGLKCDVSFVRQKFIKFVEILVPYLRKFTKENVSFIDDFKNNIEKLLNCFCDLLKRVDVSFFSSSKKLTHLMPMRYDGSNQFRDNNRNSLVRRQTSLVGSNLKNLAKGATKGDQDDSFEGIVINQETDITLIIGGIQQIINTCLDIKQDRNDQQSTTLEEENDEDTLNEEEVIRLGKISKNEANKKTGMFGGIFGGGENNYFVSDIFQDVKKLIYEKLQNLLISCIYCWNHLELFNWNDYHFTRFGSFAYCHEDNKRIMEKIRIRHKKQFDNQNPKIQENEKYLTFEEILQEQTNPIHKKVIQLLRPIAKKFPDQFIDGALNIWLRKSSLGDKVDINRSYEKIIQMLICVYHAQENKKTQRIDFVLPVYQVINSIIRFVQGNLSKEPLVNIRRWTKNNPPLSVGQSSSETLLNSFLYTYLLYNPSMFDQMFQTKSDEKMKEFQKVYNAMVKYFNVFKLSRNPFTIQWLLEILNIVSIKFNITESRLDNRLKKEYHDLFNNMLTNSASIMTESFNIQFHENQVFKIAFPPTVYEFLWRYEYISFKKTVTESQDFFKKDIQSPDSKPQRLPDGVKDIKEKKGNTLTSQQFTAQLDVIASNGSVFFNEDELLQMVNQKFEYQHMGGSQNNDQSIFQNMEILMKDRSQLSDDYMKQSDFMEKIKIAIRGQTRPDDLLIQTKFFTILTLKQILCQLLTNLIGSSDTEKSNKSMQIILFTTIQILQNDNKQNKSTGEMNEFITDFFAAIVERSHQIDPGLIKPFRREIIDLFNVDTFFQASMINLKHWQKIIKYFIDGKPDEIFEEQMTKWNFQGGIFANNNTIIVQKCYAMKRIAFLIFSCEDDEFQNQLEQLMKKMIEVFKQKQRSDIKQRLFLFFLTRVMLMRLNFGTLTEALRKLWPHLLNELINVFEVKQGEVLDKENTDLTIEAIKLVELLSSLNIEDFQMNQWIFLIDGYGMQQEKKYLERGLTNSIAGDSNTINQTETNSKMQKLIKSQPATNTKGEVVVNNNEMNSEVFKTFIVRFIGSQEYSFYNVETPQDGTKKILDFNYSDDVRDQAYKIVGDITDYDESFQSNDTFNANNGIMRNSNDVKSSQNQNLPTQIDSSANISSQQANSQFVVNKNGDHDTRLQDQACSLQQSINDSNVIGQEFNRQQAETKIEIDFLLNDVILQS